MRVTVMFTELADNTLLSLYPIVDRRIMRKAQLSLGLINRYQAKKWMTKWTDGLVTSCLEQGDGEYC
jgi:hypothetical protein